MSTVNSFGAKSTLTVGDTDYEVFRIDTVPGSEKLPFSLKVLLENLLRQQPDETRSPSDRGND